MGKIHAARGYGGGKSFKLLVLLATQARELRRECDNLRREIDNLEDYRSPASGRVAR